MADPQTTGKGDGMTTPFNHRFRNCHIDLSGADYYAFEKTAQGFIGIYDGNNRLFIDETGSIDADGLYILSQQALDAKIDAARADLATPDPMDDPRVKALLDAADDAANRIIGMGYGLRDAGAINDAQLEMFSDVFRKLRATIAAMKGGK